MVWLVSNPALCLLKIAVQTAVVTLEEQPPEFYCEAFTDQQEFVSIGWPLAAIGCTALQ
jgi:hypothetical protein